MSNSNERPGRHHCLVERTQVQLLGFRRHGVRYERRADLLRGLLPMAGALLWLRRLGAATG